MVNYYLTNKEDIQTILGCDDKVLEVMNVDYLSIPYKKYSPIFQVFLFVCSAIIYKFIKIIYGLKTNFVNHNTDFIFFSLPDSIFRTKNLPLITESKNFSIVYIPSFHFRSAIIYHKYFSNAGVNAIFLLPKLRDTFSIIKNRLIYRRCYASIEKRGGKDLDRLKGQIYTYLEYKSIANRAINKDYKGKILFEHQKFFFIPFVQWFKDRGIPTYMLQHGSFFKSSFNYLPLHCDFVLCCSEREKKQYIQNGVSSDRIIVFGAPLQTLKEANAVIKSVKAKYKYLILLTAVYPKTASLQMIVLSFLKKRVSQNDVLVRLRPRTAEEDKKLLRNELNGYVISEPGRTLEDDILQSDSIISFSEECVFDLCYYKKNFLIASNSASIDPILDGKYCTEDNYDTKLTQFIECPDSFHISDDDIIYLFGEQRIDVLRANFTKFINSNK